MNLTDYFNCYFEIVPANTSTLIEEVLRLRYQVYCVENTIFDRRNYNDLREHDLYDLRSIHQLIRHKASGIPVASVRFILPDPSDKQKKFPIEEFCGPCFYEDVLPSKKYPRESLAEVSRFLVSRKRERQIMEMSSHLSCCAARTTSIYKRKDGLICYLLLFGLISAVLRTATERKLPYWYVGIESKLLRLFRMLGITFIQLGPLVEYHGQRLPCLGSTESILSGIRKYRPELYAFVTKESPVAHYNRQKGLPVESSHSYSNSLLE